MDNLELEKGFELSIQATQFIFQPREWRLKSKPSEAVQQIVIRRRSRTRDVSLVSGRPLNEKDVTVHVYGIIGIFSFLADDYLGVVVGATKIGAIKKHIIYRVTKVVFLPFEGDALKALTAQPKSSELLTDTNQPTDKISSGVDSWRHSRSLGQESSIFKSTFSKGANNSGLSVNGSSGVLSTPTTISAIGPSLSGVLGRGLPSNALGGNSSPSKRPHTLHDNSPLPLLDERAIADAQRFFDSGGFYFSYGYDLTNALQRQPYGPNPVRLRLDKTLDRRFWWNSFPLSDFVKASLQKYMLPLIQGYVYIQACEISEELFDFILISRRSRFRAGLRYQRRGIDQDGAVANYVETEQMLQYQGQHASFVQVRGSIPLFWSQPANRLRPQPELEKSEAENIAAMRRHFEDMLGVHGPQYILNLVNQSGREAIVGNAYQRYLQRLPFNDIKYTAFDFHEVCKGFHYENVNLLINELKDVFNTMLFCWESSSVPPMTRRERDTLDMLQHAQAAALWASKQGSQPIKTEKTNTSTNGNSSSNQRPTSFYSLRIFGSSPFMSTSTNSNPPVHGHRRMASDDSSRSRSISTNSTPTHQNSSTAITSTSTSSSSAASFRVPTIVVPPTTVQQSVSLPSSPPSSGSTSPTPPAALTQTSTASAKVESSRPRSHTDVAYQRKLEVIRFVEQKGVFRVNCMDCLDRTNVVQSAVARRMINIMLTKLGIQTNPDEGIKYYRDFETTFNNAWANNGDEISKGYAGTGALKSDFTRTGKRTRTGVMTDGVNSLTRLYKNNFKDGYRQIIIDFLLGNQTAEIFIIQHNNSLNPLEMEPIKKLHDDAVRNCRDIIIPNSEHMTHGWVLYFEPNPNEWPIRRQERVVLLTRYAYYVVHYDFASDKVLSFDRVDLMDILGIQFGVNRERLNRTLSDVAEAERLRASAAEEEGDAEASPLDKSDNQTDSGTGLRRSRSLPARAYAEALNTDSEEKPESPLLKTKATSTERVAVVNEDANEILSFCLRIDFRSRAVRYSKDTSALWSNPLMQDANAELETIPAAQLREIDRSHSTPGSHHFSVKEPTQGTASNLEPSSQDQQSTLQAVVAAMKLICSQVKISQF